jgi:glycine hydroxymethyltransferase
VVSGGTDNHLILVDLTSTGVTGRKAEEALSAAGIIVNRNTIPYDTRSARVTSGIRLGTPAMTTRGFGKEEMKLIAALIVKVIKKADDKKNLDSARAEVTQMCRRFPVPGIDA